MNDKERLEMIKGIQKRIKEHQEKGQNVSNLHSDYVDWLIEQAEKVERYEKAIKECIERMNEGGSGTRSFIYEKLREVMEGTECMGK